MRRLQMQTNSITFEQGCNKYLDNCRQRNLRQGTINHYKQSYTQLYKFFEPETPIEQITEKSYNSYVLHLRKTLHKPRVLSNISFQPYTEDGVRHIMLCENACLNRIEGNLTLYIEKE